MNGSKDTAGVSPPGAITFAALDVETANSDPSSICQIGIATVDSALVSDVWTQLVRPLGHFEPDNIRIHRITPDLVASAPEFRVVYPEVLRRLPALVVTHTRFDIAALMQACRRDRLPMAERTWLDSSKLPRLAWPRRFRRGHCSLHEIADDLGITFRHHDAGEDARAAAEIVLRCLEGSHTSLQEYARAIGNTTHRNVPKFRNR